jgi:hypothetical protein
MFQFPRADMNLVQHHLAERPVFNRILRHIQGWLEKFLRP